MYGAIEGHDRLLSAKSCRSQAISLNFYSARPGMFKQSDAIRDYIFPIAIAEKKGNEIAIKRVLGTGFFIGNQGFALTAGHVISGSEREILIAMFALPEGGWYGHQILAREVHDSEDVALLKVDGHGWKSFLRLSNSLEHASCKYRLWGYPDDTTFELVVNMKVALRPDLIYNEGYIRRRYNGELPVIKGSAFFELSEIAGSGASGAPICKINGPVWDVIGIYVGEKINDRATSVSYATREEAFRNWVPSILGKSVLEESQNVTV